MLYQALQTELDRNLDLARSTRNILSEKRDMLQGDVKKRLALHAFHTDIWDAIVNSGNVDELNAPETLAACYQHLKEVNELITRFNRDGDDIIHSPLISREGRDYGRDNIIDIIQERCEEAEHYLQEAFHAVETHLMQDCPYCSATFEDEARRDQHITEEHEDTTEDANGST